MKIFFDLDGTLIDSRQRLYNLFELLIPESCLTFEEYWNLKRAQIDHATIIKDHLKIVGFDFQKFNTAWLELIETIEYLDLDEPFEGLFEYLSDLKREQIKLYLATERQKKDGVFHQLNKFGWLSLFDDLLVSEGKISKEELILPHIEMTGKNFIVGDTRKDILVGKNLGISSVAVVSGFLSREALLRYVPDVILDKVTDFHPQQSVT